MRARFAASAARNLFHRFCNMGETGGVSHKVWVRYRKQVAESYNMGGVSHKVWVRYRETGGASHKVWAKYRKEVG